MNDFRLWLEGPATRGDALVITIVIVMILGVVIALIQLFGGELDEL